MLCKFTINNKPFEVEIKGAFFQGEDKVLFEEKGSVIEGCSWAKEGYSTIEITDKSGFELLKKSVKEILLKILKESAIPVDENFTLENYHHYVRTDAQHQLVIGKTRFLTFRDFTIDMDLLVSKFSDSVGKKLLKTNPGLPEEIIILRVNRPSSMDINPFHRDGYLDIWKSVLNVWIPISGCSIDSTLPVLSGSHYWNEKDIVRTSAKGASINGVTYHVPAIVSCTNGINAVLPNPNYGEALLFTPFLIHGAALNRQDDSTRVSLELRLFYPQ